MSNKLAQEIILVSSINSEKNILSKYTNITQIGIQGPVGLQFTLDGEHYLNLNKTGVFELSSNIMQINSLFFRKPNENVIGNIIVDIAYENIE